jgi:hypothetical protein
VGGSLDMMPGLLLMSWFIGACLAKALLGRG